uniref:3'-5' exonuclease n=1 Tax=Anopheles epiroticus TaxID=199890 RepID=A0A182P7T9_9DIPT
MAKRILPLWMLDSNQNRELPARVTEAPAAVEARKPCQENNFNPPPEKKPKQPDLKVEYLPFVRYTGIIEYYTTLQDIAFSSDQMFQWVEQQASLTTDPIPIALDLEWPVNYMTGAGRTALMQLCASTDRCLLMQLSCLNKLPVALLHLLYHPRVILHGVGVKNDLRKLARDFTGVDLSRLLGRSIELGQWYNQLQGSTGLWRLSRLAEQLLGLRMNKDNRVRMSRWNLLPLSDDQKLYAAIDVYVGQLLYLKLTELQRQKNAADGVVQVVPNRAPACIRQRSPESTFSTEHDRSFAPLRRSRSDY